MSSVEEKEFARQLLKLWPLGAISSVNEALGGAVNQVFRVESGLGVFYLRIYKTSEKNRVLREHKLLEFLASKNLPAVQTLPSIYGQSIVEKDGKFGALYFAAQGVQVSKKHLTLGQAQGAGKMLARLHFALKDLPDLGYRTYGLHWDQKEWLGRLKKIIDLIETREKKTALDMHIQQRLKDQMQWLGSGLALHSYIPSSPDQVMHGDYHQENLFFTNNTVSTIIDWDQAVYMPRGFEIARVCGYMFDLESEKTLAFLNAYQEVHPISKEELEDGAQAWACHSDHYIWAAEEIYLHGNTRAQVFIPEVSFFPFYDKWKIVTKDLFS